MKKIITLLFVILSFYAYSQDKEAGQYKFQFDGNQTQRYMSADSSYFLQYSYMLGWHWGAHKKITQSLDFLQNDFSWGQLGYNPPDSLVNNCDIILKPADFTYCSGPEILNARAFQYEPTLYIDSNNVNKLYIKAGDTTRPIWGFLKKRGRNGTNENFNRRIFDGDSLTGQTILENAFPNYLFLTYGEDSYTDSDQQTQPFKSILDNYLCQTLYFSINLRRLDTIQGNDTLLKIELPYKKTGSNNTYKILLDQIPSDNTDSVYSLLNGRGMFRKLQLAPNYDSVLYITKNMVPPNNQDITISAYFKCDNRTEFYYRSNPRIKIIVGMDGRIDNIDTKITYMGNSSCPIAIDWVRIESPNARNLACGVYDSTLISNVQTELDTFTGQNSGYRAKGQRIFRFNPIVEEPVMNWFGLHYYNKLIGNVCSSEDATIWSTRYEHYINPPNRWFGIVGILAEVAAPYSRRVYDEYDNTHRYDVMKSLNIINGYCGYTGLNTAIKETDPSKSHYETFLLDHSTMYPTSYFLTHPNDISLYEQVLNVSNNDWKGSFLANWEGCIYNSYIKSSNTDLLFSKTNWWAQQFIEIEWHRDTLQLNPEILKIFYGQRPLTGEEFSLLVSTPLILGAKGLLFDGAESSPGFLFKTQFYNFNCNDSATKNMIEAYDDQPFLESEQAGSDFIQESGEIISLNDRIVNLDTIAKYQDRPKEKIYIGRKSVRLTMKKINDWIRAEEPTLMNLRLQAWYAKGYRVWYNQHPDSALNLLSKYVSLDSSQFKIRPIDRTKDTLIPAGFNYALLETHPFYEPWDSMFYDITLLRDTTLDMSNTFILGVQNRRTSPLVQPYDSIFTEYGSYCDSVLYFYPTADFDHNVRFGGPRLIDNATKPASYWQNLFWKRAGCREFTIPFNYKYLLDTNEYCMLKITEIGKEMYSSDTNKYWYLGPKYNHTIDTTIGQDRDLVIKLLPGQAKLLKCQVIHPAKDKWGFLAHSNQCKMIAHPILRHDGTESDSIRYHLVYFKKAFKRFGATDSSYSVFYTRSFPVLKNTSTENIMWEFERNISLKYYVNCTASGNTLDSLNCDHPSIVVRKVNNQLKAFIVFACDNMYSPAPIGNIVESQITIDTNDFVSIPPIPAYKIGIFHGRNIDLIKNFREWGTPVINASANRNYYAWSDSTSPDSPGGIKFAYKSINSTCIVDSQWVSWYPPNLNITKHPSLNVYSQLDKGENNCGLVWEETCKDVINNKMSDETSLISDDKIEPNTELLKPPGNGNQGCGTPFVFYTKIRINPLNGQLEHFLPVQSGSYLLVQNFVACLGRGNNFHAFPTIVRSLSPYRTQYTNNFNRFDKVYWTDHIEYVRTYLATRTIASCDILNTPLRWKSLSYNEVFSNYTSLALPNLSIGQTLTINNNVECPDGDLTLDFSYNSKTYELPTFFGSEITKTDLMDVDLINSVRTVTTNGSQVHLANNKSSDLSETNRWKNRRVFNTVGDPPNIESSAKYFYRISADDQTIEPFVGYSSTITSCFINLPTLDNSHLTLGLPYEQIIDSVYGNYYIQSDRDTIYSNWFNVSSSAILKFKCMNNTAILMNYMMIQRQDTAISFPLPLPTGPLNDTATLRIYTLMNGNNHNYRLAFINNDTTMFYSERVYLEPVPVRDTMFFKPSAYNDDQIIDLSNSSYESDGQTKIKIYLYPNPASNTVRVSGFLPLSLFKGDEAKYHTGKLILKLYTSLGGELMRKEIKSGETISIPLENYQNGLYFIRADEKIEEYGVQPVQSGMQMFIREK